MGSRAHFNINLLQGKQNCMEAHFMEDFQQDAERLIIKKIKICLFILNKNSHF